MSAELIIAGLGAVPWNEVGGLLKGWIKGSRLCIYGPEGAGKTTFWNYLKNGIFPDGPVDHFHTYEHETTWLISINYQRNSHGNGVCYLRYAQDSPGALESKSINLIALDINKIKPHFIVIVLDAERECRTAQKEGTLDWFQKFASHVQHSSSIKAVNRLRGIGVLINRCNLIDEVTFNKRIPELKEGVKSIADEVLKSKFGISRNSVRVAPAIFLEGHKMPKDGMNESEHRRIISFMVWSLLAQGKKSDASHI